MPDEFVTLSVHNEFSKRIEEENARQNHRIAQLESDVKDNRKLTASVEILAKSVQQIANEQEKISARLSKIEQEPADNWKKLIWLGISALAGAFFGHFLGV